MSAIRELPADINLGQAIAYLSHRKLNHAFLDYGDLRRELYAKHTEFFEAGAVRRCRAFLAGNRVGKTFAGTYEDALHLTGQYPDWWIGKKFSRPVKAWAAGLNNIKVRDSLQAEMLGQLVRDPEKPDRVTGLGTGMLPKDLIIATRPKSGVTDAIDTVHVRHSSGGVSTLVFKSYDAGVASFSAEKVDVIHLDEEADKEILTECTIRTMNTGGIVFLTLTPLLGMTPLCIELMDSFRAQVPLHEPSKAIYVVMAGWDDAPHLTEEAKDDLTAKIPAYQRDARIRGIPQLGAGAIYPIAESEIAVEPREIPDHWRRSFALDVGNNTGALWGTQDPDTGIYYLYKEYFRAGDVEAVPPSIHAAQILGYRRTLKWIPGVVDPAARGRSQTDGNALLDMYRDLGLELTPAINAVSVGIQEVLDALNNGHLKIFKNLSHFWYEFRLYQRDKNGKIRKEKDHLMDGMRYWWLSGRDIMRARPAPTTGGDPGVSVPRGQLGWMG